MVITPCNVRRTSKSPHTADNRWGRDHPLSWKDRWISLSNPNTSPVVRLIGVRPHEDGHTAIRQEWLTEAAQSLGNLPFAVFMFLASIASEPGCVVPSSVADLAKHFRVRPGAVRNAFHQLQRRGVMRITEQGYDLADEWGHFA